MSSSPGVNTCPSNNLEALRKGVERKSSELAKFAQVGSDVPEAETVPPAGHFHGNQTDLKAGRLPFGADHRSARSQPPRWAPGHFSPGQHSRPGLDRGPSAHPDKLSRYPDLPGRTEGVGEGAGSAWKPSGPLARVRT